MDDMVLQALARWPHVPHCYGWLGLDARGRWYLRDDDAQAAGSFTSGLAGARGSPLEHAKLIAFIARNYASDASGQWYFQNGPQRVYVELEVTPWVWRLSDERVIESHTGLRTTFTQCLLDESGWVYLETPLGVGLVHTLDVERAANAVESGRWCVKNLRRSELAGTYGFTASPQSIQEMLPK